MNCRPQTAESQECILTHPLKAFAFSSFTRMSPYGTRPNFTTCSAVSHVSTWTWKCLVFTSPKTAIFSGNFTTTYKCQYLRNGTSNRQTVRRFFYLWSIPYRAYILPHFAGLWPTKGWELRLYFWPTVSYCPCVHMEVTKRESAKFCHMFGSGPDWKSTSRIWSSLPVGLNNCLFSCPTMKSRLLCKIFRTKCAIGKQKEIFQLRRVAYIPPNFGHLWSTISRIKQTVAAKIKHCLNK